MKKILSLCLALALTLGLGAPALAAGDDVAAKFPVINSYPGFDDVKDGDWYADTVRLCYEVGLMNGTDDGFQPNKIMTVAETAVIAARMGDILEGGDGVIENPAGAEHWYTGAMTYMHRKAHMAENETLEETLGYSEYAASRDTFLMMLALVTTEDLLSPINHITSLPDSQDPDVLAFYNAGILTGVNGYGTFRGGNSLTRAEAAAMIARVVRPALRQSFTPKEADPFAEDFDRADYLLNVPGSTVYFTFGALSVSVDGFLDHAIDLADQLYHLCEEQGVAFDWGNTYEGKTFSSYVYSNANTLALLDVWNQFEDPIAVAEAAGVMKAKHILVEDKETADALYAQLQANPGRFDELMAQYGTDPGATEQPDGYVFWPGYMVLPFENGTKALKPGEIGAPVQSDFGWHIIQRLPLTVEEGLEGYFQTASIEFNPAFPDGINVEAVYTGWRALVSHASSFSSEQK